MPAGGGGVGFEKGEATILDGMVDSGKDNALVARPHAFVWCGGPTVHVGIEFRIECSQRPRPSASATTSAVVLVLLWCPL